MNNRVIIHVDMDAFFAAIEVRDNPSLAGKPLIIGALPHERGVVSTCSYEARRFGVHSAMNIKEAYRRCPYGVYMHGNMRKYAEASSQIHEIMLRYTDVIEFVALDEGYMDVTASLKLFGGAEKIGIELKKKIFEKVGVTCSVGISYCKMAAKLASEEKKPDGFFEIPDRKALLELISDRKIGVINGVGSKTEQKLNSMGINTVKDMLEISPARLKSLGKVGEEIYRMAAGMDDRPVVADSEAKSIGREHTFQENITDTDILKDTLVWLSGDVSFRAKKKGVWGKTVTLKLKFSDMTSITRSKSGKAVNSSRDIYALGEELLKNVKMSKSVRLIGVSIGGLQNTKEEEYEQLTLFDEIDNEHKLHETKNDVLEDTLFRLKTQYGRGALKTARELKIQNSWNGKKETKA